MRRLKRLRRALAVLVLTAPLLATAMLTTPALAQTPPPVTSADHFMGRPDAPVTVIEYGSFACPHCAEWELGTFQAFKARYIDTGRVRFVFRDLPTEPVQQALHAAAIARCAVPDRYFEVLHTLFLWQGTARNIGPVSDWYDRAIAVSGRSPEQVEACAADPAVTAAVWRTAQGGADAGATKTPTFFVNGRKLEGVVPLDDFAAVVDPLLNH